MFLLTQKKEKKKNVSFIFLWSAHYKPDRSNDHRNHKLIVLNMKSWFVKIDIANMHHFKV